MSEKLSNENKRVKPKEESKSSKKIKMIAKKGFRISRGGKVSIKVSKGDDCSGYSAQMIEKLKDNGVI